MFNLFLIAILIICILVFLMFLILKRTVKRVNSQTKLYYVDKMQEYDYLINQRVDKLNKINEEIKKKELKEEENSIGNSNDKYNFDYRIIDLLNKTEYQDKNIFELNKSINERFNIDYVSLIKQFLKSINDDGTYEFCLSFRKKFTSEVIYKLKEMDLEELEIFLENHLDDKEKEIFSLYKSLNPKWDIDGLVDYLEEMVDLNNPKVTIYVGDEEESYDYLGKNVETVYAKDIYRGIKIVYKRRIYDFSLNERNV